MSYLYFGIIKAIITRYNNKNNKLNSVYKKSKNMNLT